MQPTLDRTFSAVPSVEIIEYQQSWPQAFGRVARELEAVMVDHAVWIEHIGSTAVPGLCAKPVLDILMGVSSLAEIEAEIQRFAERGYRYRPEHEARIPERRYFVKEAGPAVPRIHLHAVVRDGRLWQEHLAFRDALRRDPRISAQYARLKRKLAVDQGLGKSAYTEAKTPFIRSVLGRS